MDPDYPFQFDSTGRTARVSRDARIRDLIEQVLFTTPGERLNRPTFGSGVMQLLFAPNSEQLAGSTQYLVRGALQQWLGDLIEVNDVRISGRGSTLNVEIDYTVRRTQSRQVETFSREGVT